MSFAGIGARVVTKRPGDDARFATLCRKWYKDPFFLTDGSALSMKGVVCMKCVICNERKGKRSCPARSALICTRCCGEQRILVIDCPESCEYLREGRAREASANYSRHLRPSDPAKAVRYQRVIEELGEVLANLEFVIAQEKSSSRYLADRDAAEAVDLILQTLRTEDKGILYEHTSNNLQAEPLRRQLRDAIQRHRNPEEQGVRGIRLGDAIACLELIRDMIDSNMKTSLSPTAYVDLLRRMLPAQSRIEPRGSPLIIPGR